MLAKRLSWLAGCMILGVVTCLTGPVSAQTMLAWKFVAGQQMSVELTQRVETETQFTGKPVRITIDTTLEQDWQVDEVADDGAATVTQEFRRIAVKLELPQSGAIAYDSAVTKKPTAEAKQLAESLGPLVGGKLKVKLATTGEILDVSLDEALASHLEKLPADAGWKGMFTRDGMRQLLRQSLVVFPREPVQAGGAWQRQLDIAAPLGKIRQTSDYRYVGPESRDMRMLERIDVTSRVTVGQGEGPAPPPTIKEQSQTGQLWFDAAAGRLAESSSTQKLRTEAKVRDTVVGVTVNSTLKTRMTAR